MELRYVILLMSFALMLVTMQTVQSAPRGFVETRGDSFYLDGKRWIPFGTMYRPASSQPGHGPERDWIAHYDPEEVENDLRLMRDLGFNTIRIATSVFYHADRQEEDWATYPTPETSYKARMDDLLTRAGNHGIKVLVFIHCNPRGGRWGVNLFDFNADSVRRNQAIDMARKFIIQCGLKDRPEVLAYELDWEPHVGDETIRNGTRYPGYYTPLRLWNGWIIDQYGSVEEAGRCWGYLGDMIETSEGEYVSAPMDEELFGDGPWTRKSVAYKRFIEELVNKRYAYLSRGIREVAPHHLLMAQRICLLGKVPHNKRLPFPVRHTPAFLDFYGYTFSPHDTWGLWDPDVYRDDDNLFLKQGFAVRYNRMNKPVIFDEYGASTYYPGQVDDTELLEEIQMLHYRRMFEIAERFGIDGTIAWWWIGKRPMHDGDGEVSDWGILRPDGTPKPVFGEIKSWSERMRSIPPYEPDSEIVVDEYAHADEADVFIKGKELMLRALEDGRLPEVLTLDSGTDSRNSSTACICSLRSHANCPKRALNSAFGQVEVNPGNGWRDVEYGASVRITSGKRLRVWFDAGNTGEARWLDKEEARGREGSVELRWAAKERHGVVPIAASVEPNHITRFEFTLPGDLARPVEVTLRLSTAGRFDFGEIFRFRVE